MVPVPSPFPGSHASAGNPARIIDRERKPELFRMRDGGDIVRTDVIMCIALLSTQFNVCTIAIMYRIRIRIIYSRTLWLSSI